ncbi:hypothetical protein PN462_01465 [Spirulina sp. CS-785/01]|uniref:hypothetical protein n=1 Tax=Spirulina sp. CS-785/01 TaxID=3021716 RepID=UPI00232B0B50|nr:hypothetical protein [Spirulina sp. CS-785/01]MDB9311752.1 hypothetical protein [Spirulina sp. CS-785/01]
MTTLIDSNLRQTRQEEQTLYDHLLYCVQTETPEELIDRFRRLFIGGRDYKPLEVRESLEKIACIKDIEDEFNLILNRCCHILINRWQLQPNTRWAIPELVALFDDVPPLGTLKARGARRLRQLVRDFRETEQFLTLQRLARIMQNTIEEKGKLRPRTSESDSNLVGTLINRYPYLYEHCLLSQDSSYEHQQTVRHIRDQLQQQFELDLSQYVMYQVRTAQQKKLIKPKKKRIIQPVTNPTLLSDRELGFALRQFIGKTQGKYTHRESAKLFLSRSLKASSYRHFKDDLYEYLITSIDSKYGNQKFNQKLYDYLKNTLPRYDGYKPNNTLILRTSSHLLNYLVVESYQRPNHYIFVDLVTNLGATKTIVLLLKITLLCQQVKPHLEKRFSILFNHYESSTEDGVPWLVKSMENMHIALSVHFGAVDLSYLNQLL